MKSARTYQPECLRDFIALELRAAREESGTSQDQLAVHLGVSVPTVSRHETGGVELQVEFFVRWCEAVSRAPHSVLRIAVEKHVAWVAERAPRRRGKR